MIEKIQEKIDKYEELEYNTDDLAEGHAIGYFLTDLQELLKFAKEKKKACCEKKAAKQIRVTSCRNCPHLVKSDLLSDFCNHPMQKGGKDVVAHDIIPEWCKID